jgi:hypothetical protein
VTAPAPVATPCDLHTPHAITAGCPLHRLRPGLPEPGATVAGVIALRRAAKPDDVRDAGARTAGQTRAALARHAGLTP